LAHVNDVDLANAEVELQEAKTYRRGKGSELLDANEGSENLSGLRGEGLEVVEREVDTDRVNPSLIRVLHHAYDGRVIAIPEYIAKVRLAERFPVESYIPSNWHRQRVWFLTPQPNSTGNLKLLCVLHKDQDEVIQAEVRATGFAPGRCSKENIPSAYAVEKHMELKHKDEWRGLLRTRDRKRDDDWRSEQRAQTEAFLKVAEAIAGKEGNATSD
jgi:hypothetical protein